jgi:TolB-like protein/DNA-binding winged helix-turn-helix (wHTH) protein/Flp pilus assembly protein TadD
MERIALSAGIRWYTSGAGVHPVAVTIFEFGDFRLDCDGFELSRGGRGVKLERIPMELLILLVGRSGQLVSRVEIAEHLWDKEVFVDTEHGINTAIRKIRLALRDDPEQSRFVQTVTGKGYRFIAPVATVGGPLREDEGQPSFGEGRGRRAGDVPAGASAIAIQEPVVRDVATPGEREASSQGGWRRGWRVAVGVAGAVVLLLVGIGVGVRGWRERSAAHAAGAKINSLAVLPLENLSGDAGQDYFADGMTDELTTMLAKNSTLRIVSRTSVMQYKGARRPLPEIARALGVDGVLEGSVSRSGDKVHMTIQLIQAPSDTHVWAESYDRNAKDVVSLPREAAQTIAKRLNSAVPQAGPQRYVNPEAHDDYLRGRYLWFAGKDEEAGKYYRRATELQPDYALGWAGLSTYYGQTLLDGQISPADASAAGEEAGRKAVELDDSLPEGHLALGAMIFMNRCDWMRGDQEIARAIELNPRFAEAYTFRALIYTAIGRNEEAIEAEKKAQELAPFERPYAMGLIYVRTRQYDAAIKDIRQRYETLPDDDSSHWILWEAYRRKGEEKEAAQELEKMLLLEGKKSSAAAIRRQFERGGYKEVALGQVNYFKELSSKQYFSPANRATFSAQLGRREETLGLLEEGYREHSPVLLWIQTDPEFDFLHGEERYRSIIKGIGLPPTY